MIKVPVTQTCHMITGIVVMTAETSLQKAKILFKPYFNQEMFGTEVIVVNWVTSNILNFSISNTNCLHLKNV